jgi:hypothetical protein
MDGKKKNKNQKRDLSTDEANLLREPEQFTFQPNKERRGKPTSSMSPVRSPGVPDGPDSFQINVNIGGDTKVITATVNSDAKKTAIQFMKKHAIDAKYLETLENLITD